MYCVSASVLLVEPFNHFSNHVRLLNQFYEWPKTRSEYNIFFKEVFRLPDFWSELGKKVSFGLVAGGGLWRYSLSSRFR